jgi:hypothetical protein
MPRMLGRWHAGGCRRQARHGSTGPDCAGGGGDTRWHKRQEAREVERDIAEQRYATLGQYLAATDPARLELLCDLLAVSGRAWGAAELRDAAAIVAEIGGEIPEGALERWQQAARDGR